MRFLITGTQGFGGDSDGPLSSQLAQAFLSACEEVNRGKVTFVARDGLALQRQFASHPDRVVVEAWLEKMKAGERELMVIVYLCCHVVSEWEVLPKRTKTEHRIFEDIEAAARELSQLLHDTGADYYRGGGHGLRNARISELLIPSEEAQIIVPLEEAVEMNAEGDFLGPHPSRFYPTLEEVLERVAQAARRLADAGPIHSQPNKRGALNGYFVRRIAELLTQRYGEAPPKVLAAVATCALNETIDDGLAAKHAKLKERSKVK